MCLSAMKLLEQTRKIAKLEEGPVIFSRLRAVAVTRGMKPLFDPLGPRPQS